MLDCEFKVEGGKYAGKLFWQMFTVAGGKLDQQGVSMGWNISKASFRAMVDSRLGLSPSDMSDEAKKKRRFKCLKQLDTITFAARIMVEPATSEAYSDSNKLANVLVPGDEHYEAVIAGKEVKAEPINARARKPKPGAAKADAGGGAASQWAQDEKAAEVPEDDDAVAWL